MTYYYFFSHITKPLTTGYEIVLSMDTYTSLVMKGLNKLFKSEDPIYVNSGYYCYTIKTTKDNQFVNAYADTTLFNYVGNWETIGEDITTDTQATFTYKPLNAGELKPPSVGIKVYEGRPLVSDFAGKYVCFTGSTAGFFEHSADPNANNIATHWPDTIPREMFINTYYVWIDNERETSFTLIPAFYDYNWKEDTDIAIGTGDIYQSPLGISMKWATHRASIPNIKQNFLGVFVGPDIIQLAKWGLPSRRITHGRNILGGPGIDMGRSFVEFILPIYGHPIPEFPYPSPKETIISKNNLGSMNFFLEGLCLYRLGTTTIEGYKLSRKSKRILLFDNGFKIFDAQSKFTDRNVCSFGESLMYIQNDWAEIQKRIKEQIALKTVGNILTSAVSAGTGIFTGASLISQGNKTISFATNAFNKFTESTEEQELYRQANFNISKKLHTINRPWGDQYGNTGINPMVGPMHNNPKGFRKWKLEQDYIQNQALGSASQTLGFIERENYSMSRSKQIGESQKISGASQIGYSTLSPLSSITGATNEITNYLNFGNWSNPALKGATSLFYNEHLFWTDYYQREVVNRPLNFLSLWTQSHMKYTPNSYYINHINTYLLDNGIPIGLYIKVKDLLVDNPNIVLNIQGDSIAKIFSKYFDYNPLEFETEILEFFNGTFVYWTERYPEHRGQEFKLIK